MSKMTFVNTTALGELCGRKGHYVTLTWTRKELHLPTELENQELTADTFNTLLNVLIYTTNYKIRYILANNIWVLGFFNDKVLNS
jgi:hypothetical protein